VTQIIMDFDTPCISYKISGQPVVLKNSKRIIAVGGHPRLIPSKKVLRREKTALLELSTQRAGITWSGPLHVRMLFYGAWKDGNSNVPDLSNLCEAPQDWLQKVKIIEDDRQIESLDGTRRICMCDTCPKRTRYVRGDKAGQYKPDCGKVKLCPFERVEITISKYDERSETSNVNPTED
jgi:Holliday junction resolvase RusA-like endonuclease